MVLRAEPRFARTRDAGFRVSQFGYPRDMAMTVSVASAIVGLCTTFALALIATHYHERASTDPERMRFPTSLDRESR